MQNMVSYNMSKTSETWIFNDVKASTRAMNREVQKALRIHKMLGNPIYVGDGKGNVITIQPEDIELDEELLAEADAES